MPGVLAGTLHGVECSSCGKVNDEAADCCAECGDSLASARTVGDTGVYEVTGMALGIGVIKGGQRDVFVPIIERGTPYPLPEPIRHSFQATDERRIRVPVYEGDSPVASQNYEQGVIEYELPEEIDVYSRVDVAFHYDRDRIITVEITVPGTNNPRKTTELRRDMPRAQTRTDTDNEESRSCARSSASRAERAALPRPVRTVHRPTRQRRSTVISTRRSGRVSDPAEHVA